METFELMELELYYQTTVKSIDFTSAVLFRITEYGERSWYIEIDGIHDHQLLRWFGQSEDIRVSIVAKAAGGNQFRGNGYLHPNESHAAAAIRGVDELEVKQQ